MRDTMQSQLERLRCEAGSLLSRARLAASQPLRAFVPFLFFCALFVPASGLSAQETPQDETEAMLTGMRDRLKETGMLRDAIPALTSPAYVTVRDAALSMDPREAVFIAFFFPDNIPRIYPQRVMVWHEAVNEVLGNSTAAITYSPLTGSVAAYKGNSGRYNLGFGVTGLLLDNNSVLYDFFSDSKWAQLPGLCFDGPLKGRKLDRLPMFWTTWERAKATYPDAKVLSTSTGFKRDYGRDPYGDYLLPGSYYDTGPVAYPLHNIDKRMPPKSRVLGVEQDGIFAAVDKTAVRKAGVVNFTLGVTAMVAVYDPILDTVRLFKRSFDDRTLNFEWAVDRMVDKETRTEWSREGVGGVGYFRGKRLEPVVGVDCMWSAWANFYPGTRIVPGSTF